jgi:hypothetical protein
VEVKKPYHNRNKEQEQSKMYSNPTVYNGLNNSTESDFRYQDDPHLPSKNLLIFKRKEENVKTRHTGPQFKAI